jgi:hypothetical protein
MRLKKQGFSSLGFVLLANQAFAQSTTSFYVPDPSTLLGSRSMGRASSTVASELDHDSLFQNPASSVFKNQYSVSFEYGVVGDSLSASIVDTQSGPIGGGVYYSRRDFQGVDMALVESSYGNFQRIEEQAGFALMGKFSEQLGVGASVKWSYLNSFEPSILSDRAWTFDLGARIKLNSQFAVGLLGQNLLKDNRGLIPRKLAAGIEFTPMVGLDLSGEINSVESRTLNPSFALPNATETLGWSVGSQYRFASGPVARAGYQNSPAWNRGVFSAGLGFQNKSFSLDYAFQKNTQGLKSSGHQIGFSGYF